MIKNWKIGKNYYLEVQTEKQKNCRLEFSAFYAMQDDHCGPGFNFTLPWLFYFGICLYDERHWPLFQEE